MTIYEQLLRYYLDSLYGYRERMEQFLKEFDHKGECGDPNAPLQFESAVYQVVWAKDMKDGGEFRLGLQDWYIRECFAKGYSEDRLFAIMFGFWYGLSEEQVSSIADRRFAENKTWPLLNYFLCNPEEQARPGNEVLAAFHFAGEYFVFSDPQTSSPARYHEGKLYQENTGECSNML